MLDENAPRRLLFVAASLWVLTALAGFGAFLAWMCYSIDSPPAGINAEFLLALAHTALPPLCLISCVGLAFRRRWAWWTGLAAFGLLAAMASLVLVLIAWPRPILGGIVDPDWWPLAAVYTLCAAPAALMWRPGRVYREVLR